MKVPGVEKIVTLAPTPAPAKFAPLGGVAVIAKNTWAALQGRDALKITWDDGPNKVYEFKAYGRARGGREETRQGRAQRGRHRQGAGFGGQGHHCRVLRPAHRPRHHGAARGDGAHERRQMGGLGSRAEPWRRARRHRRRARHQAGRDGGSPTLLGGGFGRKSKCDFAIEAALLSKDMGGAPVKVVWTREDDIQHGFYHTVTAERFEAGLDASNKVIAWRHRSAAPSFMANFVPDPKHPGDIELGMGWVDTPFNVPNMRMESGEAQSSCPGRLVPIRQQRSARMVDPVLRSGACPPTRQGPEGLPAGDDRPGPHRRCRASRLPPHGGTMASRSQIYPIDTGRLRQGDGACGRESRMGQDAAQGPAARHRRAPQLRQLHRDRRACGDRRQGEHPIPRVDTAIDCGFCVHPRTCALADGRRSRHGADACQVRRDHASRMVRVEQSNFNDYQLVRIDESPTHDQRAHR